MSSESTNKFSFIEIPESVDNALKNLTNEPSENVGHTLGDIWYLVFGGISHAAEKKRLKYAADLEKYHKELDEKIKEIPNEHFIEPSIQTTALSLENSKFCISEEDLRKMFVNLISNSMDNRNSHFVHPSFAEILKQMTSTEARIIRSFKSMRSQPITNFVIRTSEYSSRMLEKYEYFAYDGSYSYEYKSSISSLERLGLVSVTFSRHFTDDSYYEKFKKLPYFVHLKEEYENPSSNEILDIQKGICELTPLGDHFIRACVS